MRRLFGSWIVILILVLVDVYIYQAVKFAIRNFSESWKLTIGIVYWTVSVFVVVTFAVFPYIDIDNMAKPLRNFLTTVLVAAVIGKLITLSILLIDDIRRSVLWTGKKITNTSTGEPISRSAFLNWLAILLGGSIFTSFVYGLTNKYNYQVKNIALKFPNLPEAFKGLKLIQISDIHAGSFTDKNAVLKGIDLIMAQKPDIIVFTGDLVNNISDEMEEYAEVFQKLKAPMGVYSVLGNHDYGDYAKWPTDEAKRENLQRLIDTQKQMGWKLLMNEHVEFERGEQKIGLLGIENWGAKANFPKYGKLDEAHANTSHLPFKILLSHDPSHWDAEVTQKYQDIDLMLSGHTHGMQFGVEIPGLKWSPSQYVYKQWAGLYETDKQKLYVNRGFGFIGYPGRVGILPEITLIELV